MLVVVAPSTSLLVVAVVAASEALSVAAILAALVALAGSLVSAESAKSSVLAARLAAVECMLLL